MVGGEADVERTAEEQGELPHRIQTQLHRRLPAGKLARRRGLIFVLKEIVCVILVTLFYFLLLLIVFFSLNIWHIY